MRVTSKLLIFIIGFLIVISLNDYINAETEVENSLFDLKNKTNFYLYIPKKIPRENFVLEIKEPFPLESKSPIDMIKLHYIDVEKDELIVAITEHKSENYKERKEKIEITKNKVKEGIIFEEFKPDYNKGEKIKFNNKDAIFIKWGDTINSSNLPGGILWWIQNGTYIEMESSTLTKEEMLDVAKSMK